MNTYNGKQYTCPRCGQICRIAAITPLDAKWARIGVVCPKTARCGYSEAMVVERE